MTIEFRHLLEWIIIIIIMDVSRWCLFHNHFLCFYLILHGMYADGREFHNFVVVIFVQIYICTHQPLDNVNNVWKFIRLDTSIALIDYSPNWRQLCRQRWNLHWTGIKLFSSFDCQNNMRVWMDAARLVGSWLVHIYRYMIHHTYSLLFHRIVYETTQYDVRYWRHYNDGNWWLFCRWKFSAMPSHIVISVDSFCSVGTKVSFFNANVMGK